MRSIYIRWETTGNRWARFGRRYMSVVLGKFGGFKPEHVFWAFLTSGLSNERSFESAKPSTTIV